MSEPVDKCVKPSKGDIIKPGVRITPAKFIIPGSQQNTYGFYYDVSWPLIIMINEKTPQSEINDFRYIFALESNMIENKGLMEWALGLGTIPYTSSTLNLTATPNV